MFHGMWPDAQSASASAAADDIQERVSALELTDEDDDRLPTPVPFDDDGDWHHATVAHHDSEDEADKKQPPSGVPVAEDDPDAYEDEPFDPFDEDWDSVVEKEEIKDPTWCFECYCTQTEAEGEVNQDYQRLKKLRVECMGKMSKIAMCKTLNDDYNTSIRPFQTYKHLAVPLKNWRDHPTKHTIQADVVEEDSLKFLCELSRHLEKTTFRRNKRKHDQVSIDKDKVNLWLKVEDRRKRLMAEHRNRQCSLP
jgi:hypothetical protein